jgi:hypothetical protein
MAPNFATGLTIRARNLILLYMAGLGRMTLYVCGKKYLPIRPNLLSGITVPKVYFLHTSRYLHNFTLAWAISMLPMRGNNFPGKTSIMWPSPVYGGGERVASGELHRL